MFEKIDKKGKCWTAEKAWAWYDRHPLIIGVNYVPRYAVNTTEMWQDESFDPAVIDQELGWAHANGYNAIRVFLQYLVYESEKEFFLGHFEELLRIAAAHGISVVPVLFDDCAFSNLQPYLGKQNPPRLLVHNSGWTPSPGTAYSENLEKYPMLERYVMAVIGAHRTDDRILMWDLYNECGNNGRGAKSLYLLECAFEWARAAECIQPLTAGYWAMENGSAPPDARFNDMAALERSDIITYHQYSDGENFERLVGALRELGYPIVCTEWMARMFFDSYIEMILPLFEKNRIGSFHWGLVNGKTQTHIPWNWDVTKGEPSIWFHDVLHADGTPYRAEEMALVKRISERNSSNTGG